MFSLPITGIYRLGRDLDDFVTPDYSEHSQHPTSEPSHLITEVFLTAADAAQMFGSFHATAAQFITHRSKVNHRSCIAYVLFLVSRSSCLYPLDINT
jgi:hypothetical protein